MTKEEIIKFVIKKWEGGYVNHPNDPGGETNYGISKKSYPSIDIKSLTLDDAIKIYVRDYWDSLELDKIPEKRMAAKLFDVAINMGPKVAKRFMSLKSFTEIQEAQKERYMFLVRSNPNLTVFYKGWMRRAEERYLNIS